LILEIIPKSGPAGSLELFVPLSTPYTVKVHLALYRC